MQSHREFICLLGFTLTGITITPNKDGVTFITREGNIFVMYHEPDCCERVSIEDVDGELSDLLNFPIVMAEEVSNRATPPDADESASWTFYKLSTVKGTVTIRWYGSSNGYYSESVSFFEVLPD